MWIRALIVGIAGGGLNAWIAWSPLIPDPLTFHCVSLVMIAAIYLGFAFSDGRVSIVILELSVATVFLVLALLGLWQAPVLIGVGLILHGLWIWCIDLTQSQRSSQSGIRRSALPMTSYLPRSSSRSRAGLPPTGTDRLPGPGPNPA